MVVHAQQAGGTTAVRTRVVAGSLILTSGTPRVMEVAVGVQAARGLKRTGMVCQSGAQMKRMGKWARLTPPERSCQ